MDVEPNSALFISVAASSTVGYMYSIMFNNVALEHNKIGNMISVIGEAASLSRRYTNHSPRANHVHIRDNERVHSRHVMSLASDKFKYL